MRLDLQDPAVARAVLDLQRASYALEAALIGTTVSPGRPVVVSTGSANAPALRLYRGRGFRTRGEREVLPGLSITELERRPGWPTT